MATVKYFYFSSRNFYSFAEYECDKYQMEVCGKTLVKILTYYVMPKRQNNLNFIKIFEPAALKQIAMDSRPLGDIL
jgi:hypothetical protein